MRLSFNKSVIGSIALVGLLATSVSALAYDPWSPRAYENHYRYNKMVHHYRHQQRAAWRALHNGNLVGFVAHEGRAINVGTRAQRLHHEMWRNHHRWDRTHVNCLGGLCSES